MLLVLVLWYCAVLAAMAAWLGRLYKVVYRHTGLAISSSHHLLET